MVKMSILSKSIYRVNATPFNILMAYFNRSRGKTVLKGIHIEQQKILNSQRNPERENKSGGITLPDFNGIEIPFQWTRTDGPEINLSTYNQLEFDKGAKKKMSLISLNLFI